MRRDTSAPFDSRIRKDTLSQMEELRKANHLLQEQANLPAGLFTGDNHQMRRLFGFFMRCFSKQAGRY